jgi:hypothetical protein
MNRSLLQCLWQQGYVLNGVPLIFVQYTGVAGPWPHAGLRVDPNKISN